MDGLLALTGFGGVAVAVVLAAVSQMRFRGGSSTDQDRIMESLALELSGHTTGPPRHRAGRSRRLFAELDEVRIVVDCVKDERWRTHVSATPIARGSTLPRDWARLKGRAMSSLSAATVRYHKGKITMRGEFGDDRNDGGRELMLAAIRVVVALCRAGVAPFEAATEFLLTREPPEGAWNKRTPLRAHDPTKKITFELVHRDEPTIDAHAVRELAFPSFRAQIGSRDMPTELAERPQLANMGNATLSFDAKQARVQIAWETMPTSGQARAGYDLLVALAPKTAVYR